MINDVTVTIVIILSVLSDRDFSSRLWTKFFIKLDILFHNLSNVDVSTIPVSALDCRTG